MPITTLVATPSHVDACAGVLAEAFADDPVMASIWPDHNRRHRALPRYFAASLRVFHLPGGGVQIATDQHDHLGGVAVWDPPGQWDQPASHTARTTAASSRLSHQDSRCDRHSSHTGRTSPTHATALVPGQPRDTRQPPRARLRRSTHHRPPRNCAGHGSLPCMHTRKEHPLLRTIRVHGKRHLQPAPRSETPYVGDGSKALASFSQRQQRHCARCAP